MRLSMRTTLGGEGAGSVYLVDLFDALSTLCCLLCCSPSLYARADGIILSLETPYVDCSSHLAERFPT